MGMNTKQSLLLIVLGFSFILSGCGDKGQSETSSSAVKTIAVIGNGDFQADRINTGPGTIGLPDALAARIMEHLVTSKRFIVVERSALRKVINEQRFGKVRESYVDRTLDKAISGMDDINPLTLAVTGSMAADNDVLSDFQDLGSAVGADYLLLGTIEKIKAGQSSKQLPFSKSGFGVTTNTIDTRLRLRVIDSKTGSLVGASNFRAIFSENVFSGESSGSDSLSLYDHVGRLAAARVLDLTFPAHIAGTEPFILTRGSNDGTRVGDTYTVLREGNEVTDKSGISIGKVRTAVGKVRVISTQPTLSIVEPIEGAVAKDDIALFAGEANSAVTGLVRTGALIGSGKTKGKATIGVGKLYVMRGFSNQSLSASLLDKMSNDLIIQLGNTRRFDVLERSEIDQVLDEKSFDAIVHGGSIASRLQELVAADYIIHGQIENFRVTTSSENVPLVNEVATTNIGVATGSVRIVDIHTGKVIAADNIRVDTDMDRIADSNIGPLERLSDIFTTRMTAIIMERLYPIKVIGNAGQGQHYINRGLDGGLKVGDIFNLMRPGQEMFDPDTKISFGTQDIKVGEGVVQSVENSRSIIMLISGNEALNGDILRGKTDVKQVKQVEQVNIPNW